MSSLSIENDDYSKVIKQFGFAESSGKSLQEKNIILQEGEIYVKKLSDGRSKIFLYLQGKLLSKKVGKKDISREKRSIQQKLFKKVPPLILEGVQ